MKTFPVILNNKLNFFVYVYKLSLKINIHSLLLNNKFIKIISS